jgi:hypothetical protein
MSRSFLAARNPAVKKEISQEGQSFRPWKTKSVTPELLRAGLKIIPS